MKIINFSVAILFILLIQSSLHAQKIIGLIAARNEEALITQCLKSLSLYTDEIVFLDDCSTDTTLEIVRALAQECHINHIITKNQWIRQEGQDRQLLLVEGRKRGGTHFIMIDADEMFTATCLKNNFLRNKIFSLKPGEFITMRWIDLWKCVDHYRNDGSLCGRNHYQYFIFCDDRQCTYDGQILHTKRIPHNLRGQEHKINGDYYGVMHFQYANWMNYLIKQSWYRCLEHTQQMRPPHAINQAYGFAKNETGLIVTSSPQEWFDGYNFFNPNDVKTPDNWRKKMILGWFNQYGIDYFKPLDIWDVDWSR